MSLRMRPHTVTVYTENEVMSGGQIMGHQRDGGHTVKGMIYPVSAAVAFEKFGVATSAGHAMLVNAEDAQYFEVGGEVVHGSKVYAISADPKTFQGVGGADNSEVLLTEKGA